MHARIRIPRKKNLPIERTRRFLEPGPIVLVSSQYRGERNIMTLGWHMMMANAS
jgi:flavin reductase (DIM6/NTAB) family NADH-FMN oxidoreductase RutF